MNKYTLPEIVSNQPLYNDIIKIDQMIENYISPSRFFNFVTEDPLLDVLNIYGTDLGFQKDPISMEERRLKELGHLFEGAVIEQIIKMKIPMVDIKGQTLGVKFVQTFRAMEKGIPIIYQGALVDNYHKTKGYADLIIRSDYINLLKPKLIDDSEANIGCRFHSKWHYRIFDVKMSTLSKTNNDEYLQNSGLLKFYKIQLLTYNFALYEMQSYFPPEAYLMGRGSKTYDSTYFTRNCFESISKIDYIDYDLQYVGKFEKILRWYNFLKTSSLDNFDFKNWSTSLMSFIRPNMNNSYDSPWSSAKRIIAEAIGEHTLIWSINVNQRRKALENGIMSWHNYRAGQPGVKLSHQAKTINKIIKVNSDPTIDILPQQKLKQDCWDLLPDHDEAYLVLDFEVTNNLVDNFSNMPTTPKNEFIFIIGSSLYDPSGCLSHYKQFLIPRLNLESEREILFQFLDWIYEIKTNLGYMPRIYHWSPAEKRFLEKIFERHYNVLTGENPFYLDILSLVDTYLVDLLYIFKEEPIVVKGSYNFGLKEISNALVKLKYISSGWDSEQTHINGFSSIFIVQNYNNQAIAEGKILSDYEEVNHILYYNKIDCQVLIEIIQFLTTKYKQNL